MSDTHLKITMAQMNPVVGDIDGNAQKLIDIWHLWDDRSDLILFPELYLSGYPPEDLVLNLAFLDKINEAIAEICAQTKGNRSAALLPTPWTDGYNVYNTILLIERGEIIAQQHKYELPNYSVFDEKRTFAPAHNAPEPVRFRGVNIGFMICEDMWHDHVPMNLARSGAQILIAVNASPYDYSKIALRRTIAADIAAKTGLSLLYLNACGGQDELIFDGRSFITHSNGQIVHQAAAFEEDIIHIDLSFAAKPSAPKPVAVFSVLEGEDHKDHPLFIFAEIYQAIKTGLRDYVHKNGFENVLIGLSGGVDSALVAALAVDALGADHVRCVMLPSEFTSPESLKDAKECAQNLGVRYEIIEIKDAVKTLEKLIPNLNGTAHENTQSRLRGTILMALSNLSGEMLLTTGNKSEMAVGYATLYGDMNGGYNPLKDVYKTEVYQLCRWRNDVGHVIPQRILDKPPSAELRPDQKDQDSLPPYDILDAILRCLIEFDNVDWEKANAAQHAIRKTAKKHPEEVKKVAKLLRGAEFKRFQSPPGARVSYRAFGKDRRYPLTNRFLNDIEKDA